MSKKTLSTIIISSFVLVASIIALLLFFVLKNDNTQAKQNLIIEAEDISIFVGDRYDNFYAISDEEANVDFIYEDNGIIKIENNSIIALNRGSVKITIQASTENEFSTKTINVFVYGKDYYFEIVDIVGGYYFDNTLFVTNNNCQFQVILYDYLGSQINNQFFNYFITNGEINYDMAFMILVKEDCEITIIYPNINFEIHIIVKT